jgi:hypothetical protein
LRDGQQNTQKRCPESLNILQDSPQDRYVRQESCDRSKLPFSIFGAQVMPLNHLDFTGAERPIARSCH